MPPDSIDSCITRWENSGAAERANYQMFLSELCDILEVPRPDPTSADPAKNLYVFDRAITRVNPDGSSVTNYIDLYKARHFVNETKQGVSAPETNVAAVYDRRANEKAPSPSSDDLSPTAATKSGHGKRGTAAFDRALERAFHQGRGYITSLPVAEGRPPFLIVCDVGHSIDLYAEFSGTGGHYERFPDPKNHRILLTDLRQEKHRATLRAIWTDPYSLDPSKKAAEVTRDIANRLAKLAKSLEADGHNAHVIAGFLQRCLFTMFAEDIGLLPEGGFKDLLEKVKSSPQGFPVLISGLWKEMATGTAYSALLFQEIACFNGGLFENTTALPLSPAQLAMLTDAAGTDWSAVEPSIFGTLLTRALDPRERHKLGAEYTPRSYVERLIRPTIIEPLRDEWDATKIAAANLHREADAAEDRAAEMDEEIKTLGITAAAKEIAAAAQKLRTEANKKDAEALKLVTDFHRHLCKIKVLDPACGTANFLYVTLEHMKRLEAEVLELVTALGGDATFEMNEYKVRPEQFLGLEISHNAVAIAQLVLWIGYFQWQRKTTGKADTGDRPLLPKTQTIRQQDAVLAYDEKIPRRDPVSGEILTLWNGYTTKTHPVTGKEVPDESATIALFDYKNPRRAEWPQADYIVGNPPFIGNKRMRDALGDGYTESLRKAWKGAVPESADFVMFWWQKAAAEVVQGLCKRFGFITTNSIHQTFNRRVIEPFLEGRDGPPGRPANEKRMTKPKKSPKDISLDEPSSSHSLGPFGKRSLPLHLAYAIADHPWVDSADGAAVRIAMTVAAPGKGEGILEKVITEQARADGENEVTLSRSGGVLAANLQIGADLTTTVPLKANLGLCQQGVKLVGDGFIVEAKERENFSPASKAIFPYVSARDLLQLPRQAHIIDFFGFSDSEAAQVDPSAYQKVLTEVKPLRDQNRERSRRERWWLFGRSNEKMRNSIVGLRRFICIPQVSKFRIFCFVDAPTVVDASLYCVASDDPYLLAVLQTQIHVVWSLATGGTLEDRPTYTNSSCFDPFPFPALEEGELKQRIRDLGERLDTHRKRQQEQHPGLTLTGIYNVLEKLRSGEPLTAKEKQIHDQGLVTVLRQIHDELDASVLEAYGWSDLRRRAKEAPHSCGASECEFIEKREALPNDVPFTPPQECGGSFEDELLTRLVALNHERAAEEKRGLIRYLRPDYQNPNAAKAPSEEQATLPGTEASSSHPQATIQDPQSPAWPERLPDQVAILRKLIGSYEKNVAPDAESLSAHFGRKNKKRTEQIEGILETLKGLGQL